MKINGINFPDHIWKALRKALRDEDLVIFAGAGVSIGSSAKLPSFRGLTEKIAEGTGKTIQDGEKEDVFLGELADNKVLVHKRAKKILSPNELKPTEMHKNLLRLYPEGKVRIVTTNFDLLFERAARQVFGEDTKIETFDAPALPSGKRFNGIVHVHGSIDHFEEMVLTDGDFGRAYLTKGWARRFLVDLFDESTVVFVGYSHEDLILNYLARALPKSKKRRFTLTCNDDVQYWNRLGIESIEYSKSNGGNHDVLDSAIARLANWVQRDVLDWRREITALAEKLPDSLNKEEADIEIALEDEVKTRFFTQAASSPEWIEWLNQHKHLDALFRGDDLDRRQFELSQWLIEKFVFQHSDCLFSLIMKHDMRFNSRFWWELVRGIGSEEQNWSDKKALSKWVSILLDNLPSRIPRSTYVLWLQLLVKQCERHGLLEEGLKVFAAMTASRLVDVQPGTLSDDYHFQLNEAWEQSLRPHINTVAIPLLEQSVNRLKERRFMFSAWQEADRNWDPDTWRRSAIESHEQDNPRKIVDVLIDVARDCLKFLASNQKETAMDWCNQLKVEAAPILRRLAVHAFFEIESLPEDDKIDWLLKTIGLHDRPARHEIFMAVKGVYPDTSQQRKRDVIEAVLSYSGSDEERSACERLEWLHWLHEAAPDCEITKQALARLKSEHPDFLPSKYPDLTHWWGVTHVSSRSPWTAEDLLEKPSGEWLQDLLSFQGEPRSNRHGLRRAVEEAVKSKFDRGFDWGLGLAKALSEADAWDSDLWGVLIPALSETAASNDQCREVLRWLNRRELYSKYGSEIASALRALVGSGGTSYALDFLSQCNRIAKTLWDSLDETQSIPDGMSQEWLKRAINRPAGDLTMFWLTSLSIWRKNQTPVPNIIDGEYLEMLSEIVDAPTVAGKLGRTVLARQFDFLLAADEEWAKEKILPLFCDGDDFEAAWDGFLTWRHPFPDIAQAMREPSLAAVKKIKSNSFPQKERFVEFYIVMLGNFFVEDYQRWIAELFNHSDKSVRRDFAFGVENQLRRMSEEQRKRYWHNWLKGYWENRLDNVPAPFDAEEIKSMLNWLPLLTSVFPEAVDLAVRRPPSSLEGSLMFYNLGKNDELIESQPEEVAKLLIRLGELALPPCERDNVSPVVEKILQREISSECEKELERLKAKWVLN